MVRPNPRYDPVSGTVTTPTAPKELRPNPRYGTPIDDFIIIDGYSRNLVLEEKLERESKQVSDEISHLGEFNPLVYPVPSWWERVALDVNQDPADTGQGYGWGFTTHQKALDYLELSKRYYQAKINLLNYQCSNYPRDPSFCQHSAQFSGTLGKINSLIPIVQNRITGFQFPEILPDVFAEEEPSIINGVMEPEPIPEPVTISTPEPVIDESITDNMIIQRLNNFSIVNGRAVGSITFTATGKFNSFYYNKTITNVIQFKTPNGANILPFVKQNTLRFTETERDETIHYDEGMENNTRAMLESFVWSSVTQSTAFSKPLSYQISETDEPKPVGVAGIMGAGVAGAIGILILLGFITDSRRKK